jgi:ATP dependent DNA ligase C terminal region
MVVWFVAREVWEVRFADITLSPVYSAARGVVNAERGLSMRFPRFNRVREDKGLEEASSGEELARMWEKQNMESKSQIVTEMAEGEMAEVEEEPGGEGDEGDEMQEDSENEDELRQGDEAR